MENRKRNRDHSGGFRTLLIVIIRAYQKALSPIFPPSCIYTPTCSHYAANAIRKYGVLKGVFLSLKRILRCTPFHKGGYDPVP